MSSSSVTSVSLMNSIVAVLYPSVIPALTTRNLLSPVVLTRERPSWVVSAESIYTTVPYAANVRTEELQRDEEFTDCTL